ncbi:MAG TPA: hypothetical protein VI731_00380 [Bacteroidia bacterium]|nr:hypothetical protein [Bacteroidia bacterium]
MNKQQDQLEALNEMRDLMKRSSRFLSLSGISGIAAGVFALLGAIAAWLFLRGDLQAYFSPDEWQYGQHGAPGESLLGFPKYYSFFIAVALLVLSCSLLAGWYFSRRKAKKQGIPFWDATAWRVLVNLSIPLATGGFFCLVLLYYGITGLVAPSMLIFYGLALLNAGKYTLEDIRYLGISEIILGLISTLFISYGLLFWALGFGALHIIYGTVMYFKYER